tara:strand:+ start:9920 stop:10816 length:897 start_codon:yes stop_codon:yes gene_type:complete
LISKIIIGTWPLSGDYGKIDYKQIQNILEYCYELGIREFDTAPNYGNGVMEKYLGTILGNRTDVLINTKMGNLPFNKKNYEIGELKRSFENSLKAIKRDSVNVLFLHNPRTEIADYTDVLNFMHELKDKGSINKIGLSKARNFNYEKFVNLKEFDVIQDDINLLNLQALKKSKPNGVILMARSPLASGLLSGRITEKTVFSDDDQRATWLYGKRLESIVRRINEIRKHSDIELSELAIRFLQNQNLIDKIIFGIKRKEHVKNLLEQVSKKPLEPIIIKKLFELFENDFGLIDESDYAY